MGRILFCLFLCSQHPDQCLAHVHAEKQANTFIKTSGTFSLVLKPVGNDLTLDLCVFLFHAPPLSVSMSRSICSLPSSLALRSLASALLWTGTCSTFLTLTTHLVAALQSLSCCLSHCPAPLLQLKGQERADLLFNNPETAPSDIQGLFNEPASESRLTAEINS